MPSTRETFMKASQGASPPTRRTGSPSLDTPARDANGSSPDAHPRIGRCRRARFESLLEGHLPALYRVALRSCGHRETAEDLVQDTLLRAWIHLDSLRDDRAAKGWVFKILRREIARRLQRPAPRWIRLDTERLADAGGAGDVAAIDLENAIAALPEMYRDPLVKFVYGGFKLEEIAIELSLKTATVKTRLFRARAGLRNRLCTLPPRERTDATRGRSAGTPSRRGRPEPAPS